MPNVAPRPAAAWPTRSMLKVSPIASTFRFTPSISRHDFARIKDYFADEYLAGRTPNPCVVCNIWLKFGKLWAYGKQVGADFVATGHYARMATADDGTSRVARAVDRAKDQSYVLFGLRRDLLPHVLFPVGGYTKSEIRSIAREHGLPVHDKPDSQEICFVPDDDYLRFVRDRRPERETAGAIVDEEGTVLGEHAGIEGFTIGQRRGLGIAVGSPRYVVQIEPLQPDGDRRPEGVAGENRPDRVAIQLAIAGAGGADPLPGSDSRTAPGRARDRRAPGGRTCPRDLRDASIGDHAGPGRHDLPG